MAAGRRGGRIRLYIEGDATGAEVAAKKAEKAVDGLDSKTKAYNKTVDEQSRSTDRASGSLDRHAKSARSASNDNDRLSRSLRDVNTRVTAMKNAIQLIKWPALITGAGYAAQGLGEVSAAAIGLASALAPLSGLLLAYPGYLGAFAQGLGVGKLALFGVTDAVKEMSSVQESAGTTATQSGKAQKSAAEGVRSATETLNGSVRSAKDARTALTAAEREAVTNLVDLKNAAIDASLGEERAALSLHDAKAALRRAQNEPGKHSFSELEDLELSEKEARQGLVEARQEKQKAERERDQGDRRGVKQDPKVLEAKRALSEANHQITVSARALHTAQEGETEALEQSSTAATGLQQKLASMPLAGQKFAKFIFGLQPKLKTLQATAASGLLPGAEKGISKALALFPRLNTAVAGTSKVMGDAVTRAGEFVGSKGFGRDFATITKGNETLISRLGSSGIKWADALRQVLVVGQPLLKWISKSGLEFSTWIDNSAKAGRQSGALAEFFDKTRTVAEKLISIVGNLGGAFINVGKAAAPLGEEILDSFVRSSESFEKWTNSMKGKNELKQYFEDAKPGIFEMGRLVRDATKDLIELSRGKGFVTITRALRTELLPVLTDMVGRTTEAFGPALVKALVQVGKLLGNLAGTSGPLTLFVGQVTSMLKAINWGFRNIPGLKTFVVTMGGLATVAKALKFTGMVTGLSSSAGLAKKVLATLGLIAAEEKTIGQLKLSELAGSGVVPVGVGGRAATTVAQDVGEFGEKQALRDAGLLSGGAAASKSGSILARLGLVGEGGVATGAGLATAGVGTVVVVTANSLMNPDKAGFSQAEEKAHLSRAERRYLGNQEFNLDSGHTEKQFQQLQRSFAETMKHLKTQAALGMGAINQTLGTGLDQADTVWSHGTPKWRAHTAAAMRTAVAEIKQGMHAGTITTEEGQKEINRLLGRIKLVKGSDPFGLAEATTKQFKELNEITPAGIAQWTRKLQQMPVVAREKSRRATEGMLEEWAAGHPKLEAQIKALTDYETTKFGATNKNIREGVKKGATGPVADAFKEAAEGVQGALQNIGINANDMLKALGWGSLIKFQTHGFGPEAKLTGETAKRSHNLEGRARGGYGAPGFLRGSGKQDTVPVMAAPGEAFLTQHQQPEVQVGLALAKALGIGQNGSLSELFANKRTPHYMAKGGEVIGPRATATIAGAALNRVDTAMNRYLAKHPNRSRSAGATSTAGGGGAPGFTGAPANLRQLGDNAYVDSHTLAVTALLDKKFGLTMSSGFRSVQHNAEIGGAPGSLHTHGSESNPGATDSVGPMGAMQAYISYVKEHVAGIQEAFVDNYAGLGYNAHVGFFSEGGFTSADVKSSGILSPEEWMIAMLLGGFPPKPGVIAQGAGTVKSESGFNASSQVPGNEHEGGWALSDDFGPTSMKLNPIASSHAAFLEWQRDGGFWQAWGQWEAEQSGLAGGGAHAYGPEYLALAKNVVQRWLGGGKGSGARGGGGGGAGGGGAPKKEKPGIGPSVNTGETTNVESAVVAALGPLAPGVVSGAAEWLPAQFKSQLKMPGLNFGQKLGIANEALSYSEEEGLSPIGAAKYGIELEEGNKKRLQEKLKGLNKELRKANTPKKREALLKQRDAVLSSLGTVRSELSNFRGALKGGELEGNEAPETRTFTQSDWANAELAEAELTPSHADDRAVQEKMLGIAEQQLASARENGDPEAIAQAAQAVKQLTDTLKQNNALAEEQLHTSAELALAELTPDKADDEAARKKLLQIAEAKLRTAEEENNDEAIIAAAGEVKGLREAVESQNELLQQRESFERESLDVKKRLATIAEEQGPASMAAFAAWIDGAIGGPLQTNSRLATAGVAADYG